jgi:hypothetical protein
MWNRPSDAAFDLSQNMNWLCGYRKEISMLIKRYVSVTVLIFLCSLVYSPTYAQSKDVPTYEIGGHFTFLNFNEPDQEYEAYTPTKQKPGVGIRFTYNINEFAAIDSELNYLKKNEQRSTNLVEHWGKAIQFFTGAKVGKRFDSYGIFGKVRPGFIRFYNLFERHPSFNGTRTDFATDIGGVVEFYPSKRIVTRFDIGDTIIRIGSRQLYNRSPNDPIQSELVRGSVTHNLQFSAGIGFRF